MSVDVKAAYKWVRNQQHETRALRYAKILADYIDQTKVCVDYWNVTQLADKMPFLSYYKEENKP